jgi:VIT1/CCC1 family predicted Fe2+/Mn2+ transporter
MASRSPVEYCWFRAAGLFTRVVNFEYTYSILSFILSCFLACIAFIIYTASCWFLMLISLLSRVSLFLLAICSSTQCGFAFYHF